MDNKILYRANPIQFSDSIMFETPDHISNQIQVLRVGTFQHNGAEVVITKKDLHRIKHNFDEKVRGVDLMLDFKHESEGEAAAWFKNLWLSESESELWADVEWTDGGEEAVRTKKYRYISADFHFNYIDNETLAEFGPTLFGAALTNRPVIKNMEPTILSEQKNSEHKKKENQMNLEEKVKKLEEMLAEKDKQIEDFKKNMKGKDEKLSEMTKTIELSEKDKQMAEEKATEDKKLTEKKGEFDKKLSEGNVCEAQRAAFMDNDMDKFIANQADVKLSEEGHGKSGKTGANDEFKDSDTPAQDEVVKLAEALVKEDKTLTLSESIGCVLRDNKELNEKYNKEVAV